jgi:hypothetical protein
MNSYTLSGILLTVMSWWSMSTVVDYWLISVNITLNSGFYYWYIVVALFIITVELIAQHGLIG